jgi:hypothetical protein
MVTVIKQYPCLKSSYFLAYNIFVHKFYGGAKEITVDKGKIVNSRKTNPGSACMSDKAFLENLIGGSLVLYEYCRSVLVTDSNNTVHQSSDT